jgi:hypothetical protein
VDGEQGGMQHDTMVFGRAGLPCRVCGAPIVKTRVAQRGTHFCPKCQPLGRPMGARAFAERRERLRPPNPPAPLRQAQDRLFPPQEGEGGVRAARGEERARSLRQARPVEAVDG